MAKVFERPHALSDVTLHYCPGCTHGIIHRLVAEAIDELGIEGKTIGVAPVGCSVFAYNYFECDMQQASHGRAPAVATGIKRANPDNIVFTYQGDGDLAANWYGGNGSRRDKRRKHYRYFCKQCDLWYDGRTDGADLAGRTGDSDDAVRP